MSLTSIRLLIVEDRPDDAELVKDEFECAGYRLHAKRVASAEALRDAMQEPWDLIISDHAMPSFSSRGALKIVRELGKDIPFILVSGSIGEREAVEMMRLGVSDYILKDNLDRLVVSAERELREAENRRKRREAEQELRQSEKRLRELYAQADQLNRLKDEFLATLSHELRTPLNVIMGNSEILLEHASETGDEDARLMAEAIHRNAVHQTQLIDDLLDISSIITGKIRFEPSEIAPAAIIEDVVKSLRSTANAKNIQLNVDLNHVPAKVWADSARLQQILWNLLSNALKFTYKNGSIQVNVFREGLWVIFEVIDTGIGIDPEFLPNIFERFQQEDSSLTRRYGGLGLGLSIVRNLVDLHGGTVLARSEGKGLGATFRVTLPYSGREGSKGSVASTVTPPLALECH
ncbi:MAG TPA: ATP-binding protein [Oligoflexus sp.]|uniref:hybrid sensor histidine kinase/response regulator n=1 Tax=Oligoflexus sp. TaxID=1971216 RepID=UPI002D55CA98|nr:ATP-binding protein [Oligoflexus sp.]HYX31628.1 ATP-binding protein [Oligoflexus sp.]